MRKKKIETGNIMGLIGRPICRLVLTVRWDLGQKG